MTDELLEYWIPQWIKISQLKDKLSTRFRLQQEPACNVLRCYLDSFDWRLYRQGYLLYSESHKAHTDLILRALNSSRELYRFDTAQPPTNVTDISSPALQEKISPVLEPRALVTQLSLRIKSDALRLVDKNQKTQALLVIETPRVLMPDGHTRLLGNRISLHPFKGYRTQAKKLQRFIEKQLGTPPAADELIGVGLAMAGRMPGDYSNKLEVSLDPDMRTDRALKRILLNLLETMERNEDGIVKDIDSEFLHDFRVSVRRTRALLAQVKEVFPAGVLRRFETGFKWLGDVTGPVRDMHVYLLKMDTYRQYLPATSRPHLSELELFLEKHKTQAFGKLVKQLKRKRYAKLKQDWREFLLSPVPAKTQLQNAVVSVKQTADAAIWKSYRRVMKKGGAITPDSAPEYLHKLRIACKKLRYLLEFFASLYPVDKLKPLIKTLKQLQDNLGDFQDFSVQMAALTSFEQQMQDEGVLQDETKQAMEALVVQLHDMQIEQRRLYEKCFARFSSAKHRAMYKSLFSTTAVVSQ